MLYSMTGFGRAKGIFNGRNYSIDIKALNGKTTDLRAKVPAHFKSKEIELRKYILDRLHRGKVDFVITLSSDDSIDVGLNMNLVDKYYHDLSAFAMRYGLSHQDFLQTIIRIPNVIETKEEDITDEEFEFVLALVDKALDQLQDFRAMEGSALKKDLMGRVSTIIELIDDVAIHENDRKNELTEKLNRLIQDHLNGDTIDQNRMEQELIYYLEKMDIHEEKVRLEQHCRFFVSELESDNDQLGKKLSFISQEMGREINTMGAKAQFSNIQQTVVDMKVELDQIKEQLANVL